MNNKSEYFLGRKPGKARSLTLEQAEKIRRDVLDNKYNSMKDIADAYNVGNGTIRAILLNRTYKSETSFPINCFDREFIDYDMKNYIGKKFGKWTVIGYGGRDNQNRVLAKCQCECGETALVKVSSLIKGRSKACRICSKRRHSDKDLLGKVFGQWKIIEFLGRDEKNKVRVRCENESGDQKDCDYRYLLNTYVTKRKIDGIANIRRNDLMLTNKSGYQWISKDLYKWRASIVYNGKSCNLGSYPSQREALAVINAFIITGELELPIQDYYGEIVIINNEQLRVQDEWEKEQKL